MTYTLKSTLAFFLSTVTLNQEKGKKRSNRIRKNAQQKKQIAIGG